MFKHNFSGNWHSEVFPDIHGTINMQLPLRGITFETIVQLTYNKSSSYLPGQTVEFQGCGTVHDNKQGSWEVTVCAGKQTMNFHIFTSIYESTQPYIGSYRSTDPVDHGSVYLRCMTTCRGCLEDLANQMGHMDPGGCLYDEN